MHTHNIHTNLSGEIEYSYHPNVHPLTPAAPDTFMGYRRKDGRAAIRNEIWIIPTVGCVNDCAKALVRDNQDLVTGSIDGLYTFIPSVRLLPDRARTTHRPASCWHLWCVTPTRARFWC